MWRLALFCEQNSCRNTIRCLEALLIRPRGHSMQTIDEPRPTAGVTPHINIPCGRAAEAIEWYKKAFGAEELMRFPTDDGRIMHARLRINGGSLMLHDDLAEAAGQPMEPPAGLILHLSVGDADTAWERAVSAGAEVR